MGFFKRFFKSALATATLLASMTLASGQTGPSPSVRFLETDQVLPAGLWQINLNGDIFTISKNTAAGNNFSTATTAMSVAANGDVTIPNDFFVTGSTTVTVDVSVTGNLLIDDASWMGWGDTKLFRDAAWELGLRDGTNDNAFHVYATHTNSTNYQRLSMYAGTSAAFFIEAVGVGTGAGTIDLDIMANGTIEMFPQTPTQSGAFFRFQPALFLMDTQPRTQPGQTDGTKILSPGYSWDTMLHQANYQQFVDITSDAGASQFVWQSRFDGNPFVNSMALSPLAPVTSGREDMTASFVTAGTFESFDSTVQAAENLTDGANLGSGNWTVSGDVAKVTTTAVHTHSTGIGQLRQDNANLAIVGRNTRWYELTYTVSAVVDIGAAQSTAEILTPLALVNVPLDITSAGGPRTVRFKSGTSVTTQNLLIDTRSDFAGDTFTLSLLGLKEILGGDVEVNRAVAWGSDTFLVRDEPWALALRDGNFDNSFRIYAAFTDLLNYERLAIYAGGNQDFFIEGQTAGTGQDTINIDIIGNGSGANIDLIPDGVNGNKYIFSSGIIGFSLDNTMSIGTLTQLRPSNVYVATGVFSGLVSTTPIDALTLDSPNLVAQSQRDSNAILWTGQGFDFAQHDADWKAFVDVTADTGLSTWTLQERIDSPAFIPALNVGDSAAVTIGRTEMSSFLVAGNVEAFDSSVLGSESVTDPTDLSTANWAVAGDVSVNGFDVTHLHSIGTGSLTQTNVNLAIVVASTRWYEFQYTVSAITEVGANTAVISTPLALVNSPLDISTNGTRRIRFKTGTSATTQNLVISTTSNTAGDGFTLGAIRLKEVQGGDVEVNRAVAWGTDTFLVRDEPWALALRDGNFDMSFRIYNQFTDLANYARLSIYAGSTSNFFIETEGVGSEAGAQHLDFRANGSIDIIPAFASLPGNFVQFDSTRIRFNPDANYQFGLNATAERPADAWFTGTVQAGLATVTADFDAFVIDAFGLVAPGQQDSHGFLITGLAHDGAPHDADWRTFVDVTTNAGLSTWTMQTRIDAVAFAPRLQITSTGDATLTGSLYEHILLADNSASLGSPALWMFGTTGNTPISGNYVLNANGTNSTHLNVPTGGTIRFRTNNADLLTITAASTISLPTGPNSWGEAPDAEVQYLFGGDFTSAGSGDNISRKMKVDGRLTGFSGDVSGLFSVSIQPTIFTQTATETISNVVTLAVFEPQVTSNLTGGGLITTASTVRIAGEANEGVNNFALNIVGGKTIFQNTSLSDGAGTTGNAFEFSQTFTGAPGDTTSLFGMDLAPTIVTQTAVENIVMVASLNVSEPTITDNLTGAIVNAVTVSIGGSPTEAGAQPGLNAALHIGNEQTGTYDAIVIDQIDRTVGGFDDSGALIFTGVAFSASATDADWKLFADVTANNGDSQFTIQQRTEGGAFVTMLTVEDTGSLSLPVVGVPHAFGSGTFGTVRMFHGGAFTSDGGSNRAQMMQIAGTITGFAGDTNALGGLWMTSDVTTQTAAENIGEVFMLGLDTPFLQDNLTGTGRVAEASTAMIVGEPAGAIYDQALLVKSGKVRFGSMGIDLLDEEVREDFTVLQGNIEVYDQGTQGLESITDGGFPNSTNWAGAGDWSDTIAGTTTYTHSAGSGTLTQTSAQLAVVIQSSRWYELTYTSSAITDTGAVATTLTLTTAIAERIVNLNISTAGTFSVIFESEFEANDFVMSATSDTAGDTFTLDNVTLFEIQGGNVILAGQLTGGGADGLKVFATGSVGFSDEADITQGTDINTGVTVNGASGTITTLTATTGIGNSDSFIVTNDRLRGIDDVVNISVQAYSGTIETNGIPIVYVSGQTATTFTITIANVDGTNALNGTFLINYAIINTGAN